MDDMIYLGHGNSTNSPNSSSPQLSSWTIGQIVFLPLFSLFNVFAIVGNLLILKVVPKISNDAIGDSSKVFYMGQAVTDAVAATLYFIAPTSEAIAEWAGWMSGRMTFCKVIGFVISTFPGISILQIALLNTDRYLFIIKPMIYSRFVSRRGALAASIAVAIFNISLLLLFVWLNDISFEILRYNSDLKACIVDFQEESFLPFSLCMFGMPWLIMLGLMLQYCHIFRISTNHWNRIKPQVNSNDNIEIHPRSSREENMHEATNTEQRCKRSTHDSPKETLAFGETLSHLGQRESPEDGHLQDVVTSCPGSLVKMNHNRYDRQCINKDATEKFDTGSSEQLGVTAGSNREDHLQIVDSSPQRTSGRGDKHLLTGLTHVGKRRPRQVRRPERSTLRQNLRFLRTPLVITSCFFVSFLPPTFLNIYLAAEGRTIDAFVHATLTTIVIFNGGVNIFVYYITIKPFRQILKNIFRRR